MLVLNAPASPLSLVATTASIRCAYGRPASAASCARRSFAAATIFIALVIFWVDLTDPILIFRALRLAISFLHVLPRRRKPGLGSRLRWNTCLITHTSWRKRRARP